MLKEQGAESVIAFAGTEEHVPSRRRIEGFRSVFPDAEVVFTHHSVQRAGKLVNPILASRRPDAVFAVNGWIAPVLYQEANDFNISIPTDMLLITYDEFDPDMNEQLGLTTVVQPVADLAEGAVRLLIDRVEGRVRPGEPLVLDSTLIQRQSTARTADSALQGGAARS